MELLPWAFAAPARVYIVSYPNSSRRESFLPPLQTTFSLASFDLTVQPRLIWNLASLELVAIHQPQSPGCRDSRRVPLGMVALHLPTQLTHLSFRMIRASLIPRKHCSFTAQYLPVCGASLTV